ncbi:hypothetical protein GWK47_019334 [Chionoecetes opilio]|uniref:Uncharacterized protein n=1 Tax=Chionoecetes opilio TaxID=41210 RepID=A0A8J5CFX0_CHIOP|nr:hypothetical protein GWK47_019334 [Chionoecetes opilio]
MRHLAGGSRKCSIVSRDVLAPGAVGVRGLTEAVQVNRECRVPKCKQYDLLSKAATWREAADKIFNSLKRLPAPRAVEVRGANGAVQVNRECRVPKCNNTGRFAYSVPQAVDGSTFYHDHPEDRMRVVTSATGQVLRAKALKMLGQETESLKECIRDPPTSGDLLQNTGHIHRSTSTIQKCQGLSSKS